MLSTLLALPALGVAGFAVSRRFMGFEVSGASMEPAAGRTSSVALYLSLRCQRNSAKPFGTGSQSPETYRRRAGC